MKCAPLFFLTPSPTIPLLLLSSACRVFRNPRAARPASKLNKHPIGVAARPPKSRQRGSPNIETHPTGVAARPPNGLGPAFHFLYLVSIGESEKSNAPVRRALVPGLRPQAFAPSRRLVASTHMAWPQPPSVHDGEVARRLTFLKCSSKNDTALNAWQHDRR